MITAHNLVFGRKYGGIASIPFSNTKFIQMHFSTRNGNCLINWGDGNSQSFTPSKNIDVINNLPIDAYHTYSTAYTGNVDITFNNGLADVYSLFLQIPQSGTPEVNTFNIQDFNAFINQFSNLYSLKISSAAVFNYTQKCNIKGNVADVPNSVERIELGHMGALVNPNDLYLDVTNFKVESQLKWLNRNMANVGSGIVTTWKTYGNLAKLPSQLYYFKLAGNAGTFTYSGTKVWASSFDTLDIGNASLSATDTDNLLIDMANSITTAIGSKIIRLANCYRSNASNPSVAYLQSLGYVITIAGIRDKILDLPLQNNFTDNTGLNTIVAGGTSNLPTFTLEGSEYAATFNGSQSMKTNANFVMGIDKFSISLWLKTNQTTLANIIELSASLDANNNTFITLINGSGQLNKFQFVDRNGGYYVTNTSNNINDNTWHHIVIIYDRSLSGALAGKLYVDNVLVTNTTLANDLNGIFGNFPLFIGQRGGTTRGLNGQLKFLKIFNYPLTQTEITNLYNE